MKTKKIYAVYNEKCDQQVYLFYNEYRDKILSVEETFHKYALNGKSYYIYTMGNYILIDDTKQDLGQCFLKRITPDMLTKFVDDYINDRENRFVWRH